MAAATAGAPATGAAQIAAPRLLAQVPALQQALEIPAVQAAVAAELRAYAYACEFAAQRAEFAQIAAAKSHFGELFERAWVLPDAASCAEEAAVLVLAAELEAVAGFKIACAAAAPAAAPAAAVAGKSPAASSQTAASSGAPYAPATSGESGADAYAAGASSPALEPEICDLFFRIWATSVSEIQPVLRAIIAPQADSLEDLVGGVIKQIINKE